VSLRPAERALVSSSAHSRQDKRVRARHAVPLQDRSHRYVGGVAAIVGWVKAPVKIGEVERMKESYGEGVASHTDPESCVGFRQRGGEALTGARAGRVLSREIYQLQGADAIPTVEGHITRVAIARLGRTLRGRRPRSCTEPPRTGTGRSHNRRSDEGSVGRIGKSEDTSR
jgi:hypothetical protein